MNFRVTPEIPYLREFARLLVTPSKNKIIRLREINIGKYPLRRSALNFSTSDLIEFSQCQVSFMARIIRKSRWTFLRWTIFLFISVGVLALCFLTHELDTIIHKRVLENFQKRFVAANIYVSSTHLAREKGIELSQFVLMADYESDDPSERSSFPPVLKAEHVLLDCPSRIEELALAKDIPIKTVIFDTGTIHTYRRPDGSWSLEALKTNSSLPTDPSMPPTAILFRNTTIVLHDMMDSEHERKLILRNVEMTIEGVRNVTRNAKGEEVPDETGAPRLFSAAPFHGTAESEFTRSIKFSGYFYAKEGEIFVDVDLKGLNYSEDFRSSIPLEIAERFRELKDIRGQIDAKAKVAADLQDFNSALFSLEGKMTDGRSTDPRFPKLVSSLTTDFNITNEGFHFPNLNVRLGSGLLNLNVIQRGYGTNASKKISSKIRKIELSEGLLASLPNWLQKLMRDLNPDGIFDMDAEFLFDGRYWTTNGKVTCSNISINYAHFPYRLEKMNGEILLNGSQISCQFYSKPQQTQIRGNFTVSSKQNPKPSTGNIQIQGQKIPVDERLLNALSDEKAEFIRSLEISGNINVNAEFQYVMNQKIPQNTFSASVELLKISCRSRAFPYPLREVEGRIQIQDQKIYAQNIRGSNGNAKVNLSFSGKIPSRLSPVAGLETNSEIARHNIRKLPAPSASINRKNSNPAIDLHERDKNPLNLQAENSQMPNSKTSILPDEFEFKLTGTNVTLDSELYVNLPPKAAEIFRYVQPHGTVNVQYEYRSPKKEKISSSLTQANPSLSNHKNTFSPAQTFLSVDSTSSGIRISLPGMNYWLDDFRGVFQYQNGQIQLRKFSAAHNSTRFSGSVSGNVRSVNQWNFRFDQLTIDNLRFDQDLMAAIPEAARVVIAARRPEGSLYFNGSLDFHYDNHTEKPFSLDWDGELGIVSGTLNFSLPLTAINGGIRLTGHLDQNSFFCGGELGIDSLFQQNIQFTQITGPIWIDNRQIIIGGDADRFINEKFGKNRIRQSTGNAAPSLNAKFIGGDLYGTFALQFGYPSTFQSRIVLTNGFLENCSTLTGNDQLKGKMFGSVTLTGTDSSLHSLKGKGEFHLIDADIYRLSVMMSLLKILSLKEVNDTGFSSSDMKFRIEGNHIYFDQIDFYGDAFSLIGKGEMDFRSQVKLVFYSVMGRNDKKIPIISPLLHATGRQMLLITMKGPVQNPQITQQPLPGLNMAIQQMEEELTPPSILPQNSRPGLNH